MADLNVESQKYDDILRFLQEKDSFVAKNTFEIKIGKIFPNNFEIVTVKLEYDKYIYCNQRGYFLTTEGEYFITDGGYIGKIEAEKERQVKDKLLSDSMKDVNEATTIMNTKIVKDMKFQKLISGLTLFVAIVAVIISGISLHYSNEDEETKNNIEKQLQEQMKLQEKLLPKIDSMQFLINTLILKDSLLKKHL